MHRYVMGIGFSIFLFMCSGLAGGAEVAKIAILDFQRIIDTSNVGKRSAAEIQTEGKKMEQVLKEKEGEVEKIKKLLEEKAMVLSEEKREEEERNLRVKTNDLVSLQKRYLDVLKELNSKLSSRIRKDVFEVVENIGKRDGYLLILEQRLGGVVYAPSAIDITDRVIEEYNIADEKKAKESKSSESKKE